MNRRLLIAGILILMAGSFLTGAWISYHSAKQDSAVGGRKILHYVDPMHPAYTSDKPGIAPDCGMQLEPVYADSPQGGAGTRPSTTLPIPSRSPHPDPTNGRRDGGPARPA